MENTFGVYKFNPYVYITKLGRKYHIYRNCNNMERPKRITLEYARFSGHSPCVRCYSTLAKTQFDVPLVNIQS